MKARIGIIGAGWWSTATHIPSILKNKDAVLVGLCDCDQERLQRAAEYFGIDEIFDDYQELLTLGLDGVIIATPHYTHYEIAKAALSANVDVLVEKPMTLQGSQAWELVGLACASQRRLHVGYPWPYTSHAQLLREAVVDGVLGTILTVDAFFASNVRPLYAGSPDKFVAYPVHGQKKDTYSHPEIAGGGQGQTQVTHEASLLFFLSGVKPKAVSAYMTYGDLSVDVSDVINFTGEGGVVGSVGSTGLVPLGHEESGLYRIYGTEGFALLNTHKGTLAFYKSGGTVREQPVLSESERYPQSETSARLVASILGKSSFYVGGELGALTVSFLEAAYKSAKEGGTPVDVFIPDSVDKGNI